MTRLNTDGRRGMIVAMSDSLPPTLGYAHRDAARRPTGRVAWWVLIVSAAVPVVFVGLVHVMFAGECRRLGREPIPPDDTMWPDAVFVLSALLFFGCLPVAVAQFIATLHVLVAGWGRPRAWAAAALLAVPALMLAIAWHDPFRAFYWWAD